MSRYRDILIIVFWFIFPTCVFAQVEAYTTPGSKFRFTRWGINEGLSAGDVYGIIRDVNGFIWVGTKGGGLNKFDGKTFKYFLHDPRNPKTIGGNNVQDFIEDSLHNIWMSTENGLTRLDIQTDTFTNFLPLKPDRSVPENNIFPFWATMDEVFCGERETEIMAINIRTFERRKIFDMGEHSGMFLSNAFHHSVFDPTRNSIWMLAHHPDSLIVCLLEIDLDKKIKKIYDWPFESKGMRMSSPHTAEAMILSRRSHSLYINSTEGLLEFNLDTRKFRQINITSALAGKNVPFENYGRFVGIDQDSSGKIWFATEKKGIIVFDPESESAFLPFSTDSLQFQFSGANALIYCDKDQMVWTGSWYREGMARLIPYSQLVKRYSHKTGLLKNLPEDRVMIMRDGPKGKSFMSTGSGPYLFDPETNETSLYEINDSRVPRHSTILIVLYDSVRSKIWFRHLENIFISNLSGDKLLTVKFNLGKKEGVPYSLGPVMKYKSGLLATIQQQENDLIFYLDPDSVVAHQVMEFPTHKILPLVNGGIADEWVFLTTLDAPNYRISIKKSGSTWKVEPSPLDTMFWSRIYYNKSDKTYWVGRFQELLHLNSDFRVISRFGLEDGIPEIEIFGIIPDLYGNLWFNTDRAIYFLNEKSGKVGKLSSNDGFLPTNFTPLSSPFRDRNGDIYFPGDIFGAGFDRIHPGVINLTNSQVYFRSVKVNDRSYYLDSGLNSSNIIHLRYNQNRLTFETGIIDYFTNAATSIRYKLEGLFDDWQFAPYYATLRFDNLEAKTYRLVLQSSNANGEFTGIIKTLTIIIHPAFWDTWWFRIPTAFAILLCGFLITRAVIRRKYRVRLEKSEKETQIAEMRQKTAELQRQAAELEMQALRSQMNPHFIFNSLNSINRFILQNDRLQASEYLTKFSRLVRLILQNSQAPLISLESELEALRLYLDLEALRFENRFAYKISTSNDLDVEMLKVPPLIVQPYVENAIWHGLMHKEDRGQLDVEVTEEKEYLYFRVTDNGIGRKKAAELSSKSATKHKSMGLKITESRIAMANHLNGQESPVKINDLIHDDGTAAGTEVIIKIPVTYD